MARYGMQMDRMYMCRMCMMRRTQNADDLSVVRLL